MKKYSVRLTPKRFILWCDKCWYESCDFENFIYTLEEAQEVVKQMKTHFFFFFDIDSEDGEVMHYDFGKLVTPETNNADVKKKVINVAEEQDFDLALF